MINRSKTIKNFNLSLLKERESGEEKDTLKMVKHLYAAEDGWFDYLDHPENYAGEDGCEDPEIILIAIVDNYDDFLPNGPYAGDKTGYWSASDRIEQACLSDFISCYVPDYNAKAILPNEISNSPGEDEIRELAKGRYGEPGAVWQVW